MSFSRMSIRQQDQVYKRGVAIGLKTVGIVILVLFILLLVLTAILMRYRDDLAAKEKTIAELESTVEIDREALETVMVLKEYWETYGPKHQTFRDYFSELVLLVQKLAQLRAELEELVERNSELETESQLAEERLRRSEELERAVSKVKDWQTEVQSMFEALAEVGLNPTSLAGREKLEATINALEVLKADGKDPATVLAEFAQLHDEAGRMRGELDYYAIHLVSLENENKSQASWAQLKATYPSLLVNKALVVRQVDLGDQGIFYRILAASFADSAVARKVCRELEGLGQYCAVLPLE